MPDTLDSAQPVETGPPPPSGAAPVRKSGHRVLVAVLLVLATIVGIGGSFAVWVNRQALNTSNWASTSGKILDDEQVQDAVSAYMVRAVFSNGDVPGALQKALPVQLQPLAGPAAAGLQQLAGQLAPRVLASPQAQAAWVQANVAAHKQLLRVLNGGGPVVSSQSGVVTLNLHALVTELAATLGVSSPVAAARSKLQGSGGASVRAAAQQKLGITLPPASGELVILRADQLRTAQDVAKRIKGLAIVLPAVAILLFALAVYLAHGRRRRTLRTTGWCLVLIGVVLLLIRRIAGDAIVDGLVKVPSNQPAVHDVWNIATSLLYTIAVALIFYGVVVVVAAWLAGPTRPATAVRKALAPSLRDHPATAYVVVGGVLALVVLWGPTPALRNIWWILVFAALFALGVTMLRHETAIEFPDIEPGQALRDFREQRAQAGARAAAAAQLAAAGTAAGGPAVATASPAPGSGRVDSLERLAALRDRGSITDHEYQAEKTLVIDDHT